MLKVGRWGIFVSTPHLLLGRACSAFANSPRLLATMQTAVRGLVALLLTGEVFAAVLTAAPEWNEKAQRAALQFRQEIPKISKQTVLGYHSLGEETKSGIVETTCKLSQSIKKSGLTHITVGAPWDVWKEPYGYVLTVDDYIAECTISTLSFIVSLDSTSTYYSTSIPPENKDCVLYTECSGGRMYGTMGTNTIDNFCETGALKCFTMTLFDKFGDTTGGQTSLNCYTSESGKPTTIVLYRQEPARSMHPLFPPQCRAG
jgi:hypothetical protein